MKHINPHQVLSYLIYFCNTFKIALVEKIAEIIEIDNETLK